MIKGSDIVGKHSELKMAYKNREPNMGIYQIKNHVNDKFFIGSSPNLDGTLNKFKMTVKYGGNFNGNTLLNKEMKEYGSQNFSFEILDKLKPNEDPLYDYKDDLKTLEELWLEKLQPFEERGYHKK